MVADLVWNLRIRLDHETKDSFIGESKKAEK